MFQRRPRTSPESEPPPQERPSPSKAWTPGKGRPTPKRSEAEQRRRQPVTAPRDRKEAARQWRARQREERRRRQEAIRRGDDRYLPPRDKGPVRALARDYVDSRRTISQYFMWLTLAILALGFVPNMRVQLLVYPLWLMMLIAIVVEGVIMGQRVRRIAAERFPGQSTRGVGFYAVMRAMQIRRLRLPEPRVKIGDKI